jgi:phenylalanyl-tRNA synthetase beta chain
MRGLGHVSDAGIIYEKGVDNELSVEGLLRAVQLIMEICPKAKIGSKVIEIQNVKTEKREMKLRDSHIERLIGVAVKPTQVVKILKDLGFKALKQKGGFKVSVPSWRLGDVSREADLVEEIARVYGYDNIPMTTPKTEITPVATDRRRDLEKRIKGQLASFGFNEIYTYAFLGPEILAKCGMKADEETIEVLNPISSDMSLMRQSLLPRMLETIVANMRYQDKVNLFELNPTYHKTGENRHDERNQLLIATAGEDFRTLQGVIENLGCKVLPSVQSDAHYRHPGRTGELVVRGQRVGYIYEVHPQTLKNFDIKTRVMVVELELEPIHAMNLERWPSYQELPKYPSVKLDVSLLIPKKNLAADYFKAIESTDKNLIRSVELVDEYIGDKIAPDKRSLTYSITYQAVDRTLTEQEVSAVHQQVINKLKSTGADIR